VVFLTDYFVVARKKDNVDASAGGPRGSPTETGTAVEPTSTGKSGNLVVSDVLLRSFSVSDSFLRAAMAPR